MLSRKPWVPIDTYKAQESNWNEYDRDVVATPDRRRPTNGDLDVSTDSKYRPVLEGLEYRLTQSAATSAGAAVNTLAILQAFVKAYGSHVGQPNYNPAFDLNHNDQIGQVDGRRLLHTLPPLSPRIPISLNVTLAPQDKARGHVPTNLGGVTYSKEPAVLGHTTPGALVFTGSGTLDLKLRGPAVVADARGNFSIKVDLTNGINQLNLQAVDPYGQQTLLAFPIYWLGFARYANAHPRRT